MNCSNSIYPSIALILMGLLTLTSCRKMDLAKGTPDCIVQKIAKAGKDGCLKEVYAYEYRGQEVYFLVYPCPEGCYVLLDRECTEIKDKGGTPVCHCDLRGAVCTDDFWANRKKGRLIWEKH